jgi:23S rRNA pseudouridine2605 synthase
MERLQKFMAGAGVCSRRAAESLIKAGRVTVNGSIVNRMGARIDPAADAVKVDGKRIQPDSEPAAYFILNKPKGVVTTLADPEGRPTIADYLPRGAPRLFPAGRLDFHSEGLLLLTNNGELVRNLTHPARKVPKTYQVKLKGKPSDRAIQRLEQGIVLDRRRTAPAKIRFLKPGKNPWYEIQVTEGRKHLVRKMFDTTGHSVLKLRRTAFGPLHLGNLASGQSRRLTEAELAVLLVDPKRSKRKKPSRRGKPNSR